MFSVAGYGTIGMNGAVFSPSLPLTSNLRLNGGGFQPRISQPSAPSVPRQLQPFPCAPSSASSTVFPLSAANSVDYGGSSSSRYVSSQYSSSLTTGGLQSSGKYRVVSSLSPPYHHDPGSSFAVSLENQNLWQFQLERLNRLSMECLAGGGGRGISVLRTGARLCILSLHSLSFFSSCRCR